jgi:aromatic ring-opening dioxygenase catalytic subunit (LigB family)
VPPAAASCSAAAAPRASVSAASSSMSSGGTPAGATLPAIFVGHGGGPLPLLGHASHRDLLRTWAPGTSIHSALHDPAVDAIVVVSAHYESDDGCVLVATDERPGLLFDYGGFPPETYKYTMPNPGSPAVAAQVMQLLSDAGIPSKAESGRGHDHGVFVPLLALEIAAKRPSVPVVSVSLCGPAAYTSGAAELTATHWDMGRALSPLRERGVLLVGSGNTFHGRSTSEEAQSFDAHLHSLAGATERDLREWYKHAAATKCHPRPEHFLPLLVCAGAAAGTKGVGIQHDFMGSAASHFIFG